MRRYVKKYSYVFVLQSRFLRLVSGTRRYPAWEKRSTLYRFVTILNYHTAIYYKFTAKKTSGVRPRCKNNNNNNNFI